MNAPGLCVLVTQEPTRHNAVSIYDNPYYFGTLDENDALPLRRREVAVGTRVFRKHRRQNRQWADSSSYPKKRPPGHLVPDLPGAGPPVGETDDSWWALAYTRSPMAIGQPNQHCPEGNPTNKKLGVRLAAHNSEPVVTNTTG